MKKIKENIIDKPNKPSRYHVRIAYMRLGKEEVIIEQFDRWAEVVALLKIWNRYIHIFDIAVYKRLNL